MIREIKINAVLNGWIVNVGCQTLVYRDDEELAKDLLSYLRNHEETERQFTNNSVNSFLLKACAPQQVNAASPDGPMVYGISGGSSIGLAPGLG